MSKLKLGDPLIAFDLPGVDGKRHTAQEFSDKEILAIIFSCNHCPYVQAWEGRMIDLQDEYASRGVQLVAINANDPGKYPEDSFAGMQQRAKEKGFNFHYLHDESQRVAHAYGAERTPEVFLFDGSRTLRYHGAIDDNYDDPSAVHQHYFQDALEALLTGAEPEVASTPPVGCTIKWK